MIEFLQKEKFQYIQDFGFYSRKIKNLKMSLSLAYPTNLLFVDEKYHSLSKCTTQLFDNVFVFIYILDISRLIIYYLIGNFHCLCTYLSQISSVLLKQITKERRKIFLCVNID